VHIGGLAWVVNASKSTKGQKAEIDGKTWMLAARASISTVQARKNTLWQASTEDQLRNFGMLSFRDTEGRSSDKSSLLKDRKQAQRVHPLAAARMVFGPPAGKLSHKLFCRIKMRAWRDDKTVLNNLRSLALHAGPLRICTRYRPATNATNQCAPYFFCNSSAQSLPSVAGGELHEGVVTAMMKGRSVFSPVVGFHHAATYCPGCIRTVTLPPRGR
jgi:hypothetical protein